MKHLHQREKDELKRILAHSGNPRGRELIVILDAFLAAEDHQSVEDLRQRLKVRGLDLEPEFIEDALELFCQYGFAQAKKFKNKETLYEHRHLGHHHDHLICTRCGKVEEFVNPQIEALQDHVAKKLGFAPLEHYLEIYGICGACAKARGSAVPLCEAEKGERLMVCGCRGGEELQRRLTDMGLHSGVEIEVISGDSGPVIVACGGCRLALGRGMSEKILVSSPPPKETSSEK